MGQGIHYLGQKVRCIVFVRQLFEAVEQGDQHIDIAVHILQKVDLIGERIAASGWRPAQRRGTLQPPPGSVLEAQDSQ